MAERICARESRPYNILRTAFSMRDEFAASRRAEGKKCVYMLGDDVPEELILAAGMQPVRLIGEYGEQPNADKYLERSFGPLWRAYFEKAVGGAIPASDFLVMSNSSDIIQRLYYYMLQLGRMEPERPLPTLYYIDYSLMVKDFSAQERNVRETRGFMSVLESWSGRPLTAESLREAIDLCSAHRRALCEVSSLRRQGRITGSEALNIIAGSFFMDRAEAAAVLGELVREAAGWPVFDGVRAVYTGSMQESGELYSLMEECGINIIADDKLIGDRFCDRDVDAALRPDIAVTQRYHLRFPSSERGFVAERAESIAELVRSSGAEAIVVFMYHNDESYIWDLPKQKKRLDEMGVKTLTVEKQLRPLRDKDGLRDEFIRFAAEVRGGAANG